MSPSAVATQTLPSDAAVNDVFCPPDVRNAENAPSDTRLNPPDVPTQILPSESSMSEPMTLCARLSPVVNRVTSFDPRLAAILISPSPCVATHNAPARSWITRYPYEGSDPTVGSGAAGV